MCVIIIIREDYRFIMVCRCHVSVHVCCMLVHYACVVHKNILNKLSME